MRIVVLADTHVPKRAKDLPPALWREIENADAVIHAGDIVGRDFLEELKRRALLLYAVKGNNDVELDELPEVLQLQFGGVNVAIVHETGSKDGRAKRMRKKFPHAAVVIFGHSHIPMDVDEDGVRFFNPGSPTDKRMQPKATYGVLEFIDGKVSSQILEI